MGAWECGGGPVAEPLLVLRPLLEPVDQLAGGALAAAGQLLQGLDAHQRRGLGLRQLRVLDQVRDEAPLTMLVPTTLLAIAVVLLGLYNGEIVSRFIEPMIPASFTR